MADFSKQFDGVMKSIRSTINPEYAISAEEKDNPLNVRILRLSALVKEALAKKDELASQLSKIDSNLHALIEEIQPLLVGGQVADAKPESVKTVTDGDKSVTSDSERARVQSEDVQGKSEPSDTHEADAKSDKA